jgi:protease YdgD
LQLTASNYSESSGFDRVNRPPPLRPTPTREQEVGGRTELTRITGRDATRLRDRGIDESEFGQLRRNRFSRKMLLQSVMTIRRKVIAISASLPCSERPGCAIPMKLNRIFLWVALGSLKVWDITTTLAQPSFNDGRSLWTPNVLTPADPRPGQPKALSTPNNRLPVPSREWPWSAIGRVNVANGRLSFCTGTLVAPRTVVTAAHCLWAAYTNRWVKPDDVHFVFGEIPGSGYLGHSIAASFVASPNFRCTPEDCPLTYSAGAPHQGVRPQLIKTDWAIITLRNELGIRPIPIEAIRNADFSSTGDRQIVLPGFGADRPFLLAAHKGCSAKTDAPELGSGSLTHECETFQGGSGSPVLLMRNGRVSLIGIATAAPRLANMPNARGTTHGYGVSATEFAAATGVVVPTGQ